MSNEKPAPPERHLAKITLGFTDYVLPVTEATKVLQALEKAERYQFRYRSEEDGGPMHHIWSEPPRVGMELVSYGTYLQGKFTGKPEDD